MVHLVVRQYDSNSNVPGTSSSVPLQLKSTLPDFRSLSRSLRSFIASNTICCSIAYCLYVTDSADSVSVPRTGKECMARLRQNPWYRDYERLHDRSGRQATRSDESVRCDERARDLSARQALRSDESVRHVETSSRRLSRQSVEVKRKERARDRSARQAARSNADVRRSEQSSNTSRKEAAREFSTLDELVTHFKHSISTGPVFVCSSCCLLYTSPSPRDS